ncbi:MAG: DNA primase, partial [Hyphomicrobiales bacterium]
LLPEGQDPDDLVRAQGPDAMEAVLSSARPLADMLWVRETEGRELSTPERRADLEAKLETALAAISNDKVRHHYSQFIREKLNAMWNARSRARPGRGGRQTRGGAGGWTGRDAPNRGQPRGITQSLKRSALARATGSGPASTEAVHRREAVLLMTVVNHPGLLDRYGEEFAEVEFSSAQLDRLRNEILDIAALHAPLDTSRLDDQLDTRGLLQSVRQAGAGLMHKSEWFMERDAAATDAETGWRHTLMLHRKSLTLQKELKAAERVLADEPNEENLAHLNDIREQIRSAVGEEATIEGFGEASGRVSGASL